MRPLNQRRTSSGGRVTVARRSGSERTSRECASVGPRTSTSPTEEAIEEAELRARVRLDAGLARGVSTEGRAAQDSYLAYLLEGLGITDPAEVEAAAAFRQSYNAPAGLFDRAFPEAQSTIRRVKAAGLVVGVVSNSNGNAHALLKQAG